MDLSFPHIQQWGVYGSDLSAVHWWQFSGVPHASSLFHPSSPITQQESVGFTFPLLQHRHYLDTETQFCTLSLAVPFTFPADTSITRDLFSSDAAGWRAMRDSKTHSLQRQHRGANWFSFCSWKARTHRKISWSAVQWTCCTVGQQLCLSVRSLRVWSQGFFFIWFWRTEALLYNARTSHPGASIQ